MRIVVTGSDGGAVDALAARLRSLGHAVSAASPVPPGVTTPDSGTVDLTLLYWSENDGSLPDACRGFRESHSGSRRPYLLIASPNPDPDAMALALDAGADDLLALPSSDAVLSARLALADRRVASRDRRALAARNAASRLEVEAMVADCSAILATRQRGGVQSVLPLLGKALRVCRVAVFRFVDQGMVVDNRHEWCREGVTSVRDQRRNIPAADMPWWMERVKDGQRIILRSHDDVPPGYPGLLRRLIQLCITARADVPLYSSEGDLLGYLGVEMTTGPRDWMEEDIRAMFVVARMIGAYWERREVLDALRLRDRAIQGAYDGIVIIDAVAPGRPIVYANHGFCRMTGYALTELIGINPGILEGPQTDPDASAEITASMDRGVPCSIEIINHRKDGTPMWNRTSVTPIPGDDGTVTHFIAVFSDLTEQRHAESTLLESEQRFRAFAETVPDAMVMVDSGGAIVSWNPSATEVFGLGELEAVGGDFARLVPPAARRLARRFLGNVLKDAVQHGASQHRFSATGMRSSGGRFPLEVSLAAWATPRGPFAAAVMRDDTRRIQLESQLRQSQKMEALGTLAGGIAHDFNNILGPIFAHTELAIGELPQDSRTRDRLGKVLRSARRAKSLVERILAFSRKGPEGNTPVELAACVSDSVSILSETIPKNVRLAASIDAAGAAVLADPAQVHQVVLNLVTNAVQAIGVRTGNVRVSVWPQSVTHTSPEVSQVAPGDYVVLRVEDDGPGIPASVLARVFEPFYTTKSDGSGTGLGLSAVHSAVTQTGGNVLVTSEVGTGTAFSCYWRRAADASDGIRARARQGRVPAIDVRGRVLVIDDETEMADAMGDMLRTLGFRTTVCHSSSAGLDVFTRAPGEYQAVITDRMMPGMDGLALTRAIRGAQSAIPVILVTGLDMDGLADVARNAGVTSVLRKPVTLDLLRVVLNDTLSGPRR